jgi:hypothetical protein
LERDTPLEVVHILTLMANGWTSVSEIKGRWMKLLWNRDEFVKI